MADLRKIKKEKGSVLVPGANRLRRGVNFAVEVPQGVQASLVLTKRMQESRLWRSLLQKRTGLGISVQLPCRI